MPMGTSKTPRYRKYGIVGFGCILVVVVFVLVALLVIRLSVKTGSINIEEVTLTGAIRNEDGEPLDVRSEFSSSQSRIYCVVDLSAATPILLTVKWYHEDTLIREDRTAVTQRGVFYIEPLDGDSFSAGNYHVDIHLANFKKPLRTVSFSIAQNQ